MKREVKKPTGEETGRIIDGGVSELHGSTRTLSEAGSTVVNALLCDVIYLPNARRTPPYDQDTDKTEPTYGDEIHPLEAVAYTVIDIMALNAEKNGAEWIERFSKQVVDIEAEQ